MHPQIDDTLQLDGEHWSVIHAEGGALVHPRQFGMTPQALHAGCTRGYFCAFEISDTSLVLRSLTVRCADARYPPLCGLTPRHDRRARVGRYAGLALRVAFTGRVCIGQPLAPAVHRGAFSTPRRWRQRLELEVAEGELERIIDLEAGREGATAGRTGVLGCGRGSAFSR